MKTRAVLILAVLALGACAGAGEDTSADRPTIVVTTSILGAIVQEQCGSVATVETLMPPGASPHDFQASAQQIARLRDADAVIANGGGFEVGLVDALDAARRAGTPVFATLAGSGPVIGDDPHFFTDPSRMAMVAVNIDTFLTSREIVTCAAPQSADLDALDAEIEEILSTIPAERRVLVTNHEALTYFADRYDFEVVGVIIPGGGTSGQPSAGELDALADVIRERHVPAIFADSSSPDDLAAALADETGDVEVVELYSESLPAGMTYAEMMRTNAQRIADALAP